MEFGFNVSALLNVELDGIAVLSGQELRNLDQRTIEHIFMVLNEMGTLSAKAQGLKSIITTGAKFTGTDQKLFIKCDGKKVIGFLKIGKKTLFIRDAIGTIKEITPMCLLDFYVHESQQRNGYGKILFDKMLKTEKLEAKKLGYDRPSSKLLKFLEKNFYLIDYIPQNNNFVVYSHYFENTEFNKSTVNPNEKDNRNYNLNNRNISYGFFANQINYDNNPSNDNYSKNIKTGGYSLKSPWANSSNNNDFVSSSSSYGACYAFENKKNKKYY